MRDDDKRRNEEPLLLTMLPFAGLALLLVLALVWRVLPARSTSEADAPTPAAENALEAARESAVDSFDSAPERSIRTEPGRDYARGPDDARIELVLFSDFECPYCRTAANGLEGVLEAFPDDVRLVFKNFPLDTSCNDRMTRPLHQFACDAAELARCAGSVRPELFWQAHDALFATPTLSRAALDSIREGLDAPAGAIESCMNDNTTLPAIREDVALARELGISGTPVFFANGKKLSDYRGSGVRAVIEHILASE